MVWTHRHTAVIATLLAISCADQNKIKPPSDIATAYTTAQLSCVAAATTLAESKACRRKVDAMFGVEPEMGVGDGGVMEGGLK